MLNIKKISPLYIPILYIYIYISPNWCWWFWSTSWRHVEALKVGFRAERPEIWRGGLEPQPTPLSLVNRWLRPCEWIHLDPKKEEWIQGWRILTCFFVGPLQANARLAIEFPSSKAVLPWFIDKNDEEPIETRALIWFQWEMYVFGTRKSELTN